MKYDYTAIVMDSNGIERTIEGRVTADYFVSACGEALKNTFDRCMGRLLPNQLMRVAPNEVYGIGPYTVRHLAITRVE